MESFISDACILQAVILRENKPRRHLKNLHNGIFVQIGGSQLISFKRKVITHSTELYSVILI